MRERRDHDGACHSASGGGRGAYCLRGGVQEELHPRSGQAARAGRCCQASRGHRGERYRLGVGTAWLHSGLGAAARLVTVERDEELARRAAGVFADDERVSVLTGDWRLLEEQGPFDVFFCDGGGKRDDPQRVVDLLAPAGFSSLTTSLPRPTGRPGSRAKWMSSAFSTSLIRTWKPLKCSQHPLVQRLLRHVEARGVVWSGPPLPRG